MLDNVVGNFLWLMRQALGGLLYGWPISVVLLILLTSVMFFQFSSIWNKYKLKTLILLTPLIIPLSILFMGAFCLRFDWVRDPSQHKIIEELINVVNGLLLSHIVVGIYFCLRFEPFWLLVLVITLFQLWFSLWARIIAGMAISGDWI